MAKIVIDGRIINSSTGRYVERLVTYLQKIDHDNHYVVLVPSKDRDYWKSTADNFEVQTVDFKNYSLGEQVGFCKFLYSLDADLVHFCMPQQPVFYTKPHVTTVHDLTLLKTYNSDKNWFMYHFKQAIGRVLFYVIGHTSKHILTDAEYTKKEYAKFAHIPLDKITVALLAADKLANDPEPYPEIGDTPFLLYVGQQSDYKNVRRLIQAHQALRVTRPDLELVLVGSLSLLTKRNQQWVAEQGFKGVRFTGFVSDDQLAWLYQQCQSYVFPSLMEGFGLPGLEAMVHGAPVVSSNATCLPEVYGDAVRYFDPTSVQDMIRAVGEVLDDEALRVSLIQSGTLKAQEYSWDKMAEQTLRVYRSALS